MTNQGVAQTRRLTVLLVAILVFHVSSLGDDWTVGVGGNPARNSLSMEHGPWADNLIWGEGLTSVIAQQAVIEGQVVAMSRIHDLIDVLHGTLVVAHDLMTGDTLWTAELPVDFPATDWRSRVSAIRDGRVYATRAGNTNAAYLYAFDAVSGAILWQSEDLITENSTEGATLRMTETLSRRVSAVSSALMQSMVPPCGRRVGVVRRAGVAIL
jgi:hypothetical protein